jgi:hypothetical protein
MPRTAGAFADSIDSLGEMPTMVALFERGA